MQLGPKKFFGALLILVVILVGGTVGYMMIDNFSFNEALYMTVITISTVGFGEIRELSIGGRLFTVLLILSGISVVIYAVGNLTTFFVEGEVKTYLRRKKMAKEIGKLKDHYIIAGLGRTGKKLVAEFCGGDKDFVVIERNQEEVDMAMQIQRQEGRQEFLYVIGDATDDTILKEAGIEEAKMLMSVLSTDADNLFVTLSSKNLNPNVKIITRGVDPSAEPKLRRAGADSVIQPVDIEASRMYSTATQRGLVSFLDVVKNDHSLADLSFSSIPLAEKSSLVGQTLREAKIPQKTNLIIIGIEKKTGLDFNPRSHVVMEAGDKLMVLGKNFQIEALKHLVNYQYEKE